LRTDRAAFVDVDHTLIHGNSMGSFLRHLGGDVPAAVAALRGLPRAQANRAYFRMLAGRPVSQLSEEGRAWFTPEMFTQPVLEAVREHRRAGDRVFLVSGSFFACLDPIAEAVGADRVFCTRPVVRDGRLTGEVLAPMLDELKARVVRLTAVALRLDLASCSAYGDHVSDLPMLAEVGRPVVVGDDPALAAAARERGWEVSGSTPAAAGRAAGHVPRRTDARAVTRWRPGPAAEPAAPRPSA
jgi:HAD superfamily hydrolase (TIGR01490 family)